MLGHELDRSDVERLVRVEAGVQFLVDSELDRQKEIAAIEGRLSVLEKWQSRVIGTASIVSAMIGAVVTWLFTKI